ncbi:5-carboxymethyl-2-hydroxymuconate Delta-isomerase [Streptomyces sp. HPF1205]|uniref:5-carboxymethyl-2-hydroxymuconate Delta-isomerase n=1 Tax=Streptomyces sp. HPF1205 TaxID=2873262 RepID=UPI001CED202C|nr:isomerase [Streptomyces sp. HPF1205]
MPHITVRFSDGINSINSINPADSGEGRPLLELAAQLQDAVVTIADGRLEGCRVHFPSGEGSAWVIAGEEEGAKQAVHVEIAIKAGRTDEVKARLSQAALDVLRTYLPPAADYETYLSVEVREIDPVGYVSHVEPRKD